MATNWEKLQDLLPWLGKELRKACKGGECQLRGPTCDWGTETTVGAHLGGKGGSGMGYKCSDSLIAQVCGPCHAWLGNGQDPEKKALAHDALKRTNELRRQEGLLP